MLTWCAGEDLISENPWSKYAGPRVRHGSHQGTLEAFQKIYAVLPDWMQWPCRVAMACCLRPGVGELFSLRWKAFYWHAGAVTVYMGKVGASKTVYVPEAFLAEAWGRYDADGQDGDVLVCRGRSGQAVTQDCYYSAWRRACRVAGVKMAFYAIRHIVASMMLAGGADLAAVAAQLGHKDLTTTGQFYVHALPKAQRAAARALPSCTTLGADGAVKQGKA